MLLLQSINIMASSSHTLKDPIYSHLEFIASTVASRQAQSLFMIDSSGYDGGSALAVDASS